MNVADGGQSSQGSKKMISAHLNGSVTFTLQALAIWALVALPGNIVTLVLLNKEPASTSTFVTALGPVRSLWCGPAFEIWLSRIESIDLLQCLASHLKEPRALNHSSASQEQCYESHQDFTLHQIKTVKFWIEGVCMAVVGLLGLVANGVTCLVLKQMATNSNFNKLLISLAVADSLLILDNLIQKSLIGSFLGKEPLWYIISYPYFWHPIRSIIMNATIFLLVAISAERYRAVCHPLSSRQPPSKFIILVLVVSVTLDIPRFFQFQLEGSNSTNFEYWPTPLMEDPVYIRFSSYWEELFITGIVPLAALIFFNSRIYLKIRASSRFEYRFTGGGESSRNARHEMKRRLTKTKEQRASPEAGAKPVATVIEMIQIDHVTTPDVNADKPCSGRDLDDIGTADNLEVIDEVDVPMESKVVRRITSTSQLEQQNGGGRFQKRREKSTIILVTIVLLFLACHSYRLALKIFEFADPSRHTMDNFNLCFAKGRHHVPIAFYVLHNLNYLFLVCNSAVNFIVYCCVGKEFRARLFRLLKPRLRQ